jgi:hypothetical protein
LERLRASQRKPDDRIQVLKMQVLNHRALLGIPHVGKENRGKLRSDWALLLDGEDEIPLPKGAIAIT